MDTTATDNAAPDPNHSRRMLIFFGVFIVFFFFVIDDLIGWIEGGGIFSIISAYRAVQSRTAVIDVDGAGLRIFFIMGCSFAGTVLGLTLSANFGKKLTQFIIILGIIGGGFILDGVYGDRVIENFMTRHGYQRCAAGDWAQGNGKSRVWFDDYVRTGIDCRKRMETVKDRAFIG